MNSSVWTEWAGYGSKEKKSGFEFFWATFECGFFNFFLLIFFRTKKLHKIKLN